MSLSFITSQYYAGLDDLPSVFDSVIKCHEKWFNLCLALNVPYSKLSGIRKSHPNDLTTCLCEGLAVWLKGDYSEDQHGPPSWRTLVAAVVKPSGGNHTALALEIAEKQGRFARNCANIKIFVYTFLQSLIQLLCAKLICFPLYSQ